MIPISVSWRENENHDVSDSSFFRFVAIADLVQTRQLLRRAELIELLRSSSWGYVFYDTVARYLYRILLSCNCMEKDVTSSKTDRLQIMNKGMYD